MRRTSALVFATLACVLAASVVPAAADPEARLQAIERRQEAVQAQLRAVETKESKLSKAVRTLDDGRATAEDRLNVAEFRLAQLEARIRATTRALTRVQQELAIVTANLVRIQKRLVVRTDILTERAVAAYKSGPMAYVDGILAAQDFGELVDRYEYYQAAQESDIELVASIEDLRDAVEHRRDLVEARQRQIARTKLKLESDRAQAAELREQRAEALAVIETARARKSDLLAETRRNKEKLEAIERQLQQDSAEIQALLARQATAASSGTPQGTAHGTGQLLWPANGPLTSEYGYRVHPIFGTRRMHTGIDIGAGYGAPVFAADRGTVVYVGTMSGYGNVVVVDHGGGLATTYNHLSSFNVVTGQKVGRGATIAGVGCTGYCTGPHLHFEVRVNGSPVDPMPYLS